MIAKNKISQADENGHNTKIAYSIVDCSKDANAVNKADMYLRTKSRQQCILHKTSHWSLFILRKNGEEEWMPLNCLKQSLPLETAEFAVARGIENGPAFK